MTKKKSTSTESTSPTDYGSSPPPDDDVTRELLARYMGTDVLTWHIGRWCIARSRDQGVMYGLVLAIDGRNVVLAAARQLYSWRSKFVLPELASFGPVGPTQSYGHPSVEPVRMTEVCGLLAVSSEARAAIDAVEPKTC